MKVIVYYKLLTQEFIISIQYLDNYVIVIINYDQQTRYNIIFPLMILEVKVTHVESIPADKYYGSKLYFN